ncbi:MAG: prepilin-type N-terminal cleavage/methylation domain-containing protein [Armatimonadetes bacterium]|nr:prepilin-type N-terminal cleavage/methylation domain-containing protein [Armatimonadota bacterium]
MSKRAFTLIEVMIATTLLVLIVAGATTAFGFVVKRNLHGIARFASLRDGSQTLSGVEETISQAVSCSKVSNGSSDALVCTMPLNGVDSNSDGALDQFTPTRISKRGVVHYGKGQRVWFYLSDSQGAFGNSGNYFFRAVRNDDNNPTLGDIDTGWSYLSGSTQPSRGPVSSCTFSVNASNRTVAYSIQFEQSIRTNSAPSANEDRQGARFKGVRGWRNLP